MKQLLVSISAAVAVSFAIGTAGPAAATPASVPQLPQVFSDPVQEVQYRQWRDRDRNRSHRPGRLGRPDRSDRYDRGGYHNGWRGYRERRRGYRYHDGWWFPPAAFALGAIIGSNTRAAPRSSLSIQHVRWCENRYRSYRASDNTFQPYNGPRRQCTSPYM